MTERSWNQIETELRYAKAALAQRSPLYDRKRHQSAANSVTRLTAELRAHSEFMPRMTGRPTTPKTGSKR
jgi:hypothetical protein